MLALDHKYKPVKVEAPAGEEITVILTNKGKDPHSFTLTPLECNTGVIHTGEEISATFTMPTKATEYHCILHENMKGELVPT